MRRIDIALSGGVDSTVAGALLIEAGHTVRGVTMALTEHTLEETIDAGRGAADALGIEHRVVDLRGAFEDLVVSPFAREYAQGRTPNPCVNCNESVKFGLLLRDALTDGADRLATGHYVRLAGDAEAPELRRGADLGKDQSYFLYRLTDEALRHSSFPLGGLTKDQVRDIASDLGLPCRDRAESQEACFAPDGDHTAILRERCPEALTPGPTVDCSGNRIGTHGGVGSVTIGQRRGLGVSGGPPVYAVSIHAEDGCVVAGGRDELETLRVVARDVVWRGDVTEGECTFKFRHGAGEAPGRYRVDGALLTVLADEPLSAVAPGQSLVCYKGDAVLGGGVITAPADREGTL